MRVLAGESKKKEAQGTKGKIIIETHVDTTLSVLRALDLDRVHRLLETRLGEEGRSVADSSADGDELSSTSVDGVGVKGNIHLVTKGEREPHDVEPDTSLVLLANDSLLGGPLEGGDARVLDLVEVLDSLGNIDEPEGG
jgi:hypothetical protein